MSLLKEFLSSLWALMLVTVNRLILTHPVVYGSEYPDDVSSVNTEFSEFDYELSPYPTSKDYVTW